MKFSGGLVGVRGGVAVLTLWASLHGAAVQGAGQQTSAQQQAKLLSGPPSQWAMEAAENEIKIVHYSAPYLRYRVREVDTKGDQTRDVIESKNGSVARLIERSGKPLTRQQDDAERSRLRDLLNSPQAFAKHISTNKSGKDTAVEMLGMLPVAMLYSYTPGQPARPGFTPRADGLNEIVLDFKPNPQWKPPTLKAEALSGLDGRLWIDPLTRVVTRLDGRIFEGINLGWGMLAHIYPGGTVMVEQVALPNHRFFASHFVEDVTIRAMLVKTVKVHADVTSFAFTPIEMLTFQEAIQKLLDTPVPTVN